MVNDNTNKEIDSGEYMKRIEAILIILEQVPSDAILRFRADQLKALLSKSSNAHDGLISVTEAGKIIGVSRQAVLVAIRQGRLKAHRIGEYYVIDRDVVVQYKLTSRNHGSRSEE